MVFIFFKIWPDPSNNIPNKIQLFNLFIKNQFWSACNITNYINQISVIFFLTFKI